MSRRGGVGLSSQERGCGSIVGMGPSEFRFGALGSVGRSGDADASCTSSHGYIRLRKVQLMKYSAGKHTIQGARTAVNGCLL